jgi:EAL domain-containing protein (putative c-di-GMP-specific phosphodiesterase class I)
MDALAASGLPPQRLELEITETLLLHNYEGTLATLHRLRDHGISIALDDLVPDIRRLHTCATFASTASRSIRRSSPK